MTDRVTHGITFRWSFFLCSAHIDVRVMPIISPIFITVRTHRYFAAVGIVVEETAHVCANHGRIRLPMGIVAHHTGDMIDYWGHANVT